MDITSFDPHATKTICKEPTSVRCTNLATKSSDTSLLKSGANLLRLKQRSLPGSVIAGSRSATSTNVQVASTSSTSHSSSAKTLFSLSTDSAEHRPIHGQRSVDFHQSSSHSDIASGSSGPQISAKDWKWIKRGKKVFY
ncbi:unnamed protein product [Echinostoma caproni]|uniref:Uncharacterized protein n=1 Tax=Echinostoma caproni TaxID=27848 RepID=A0A183B1B9_9TREM|nr:unnamed protein product [Echinostoma caproni]